MTYSRDSLRARDRFLKKKTYSLNVFKILRKEKDRKEKEEVKGGKKTLWIVVRKAKSTVRS